MTDNPRPTVTDDPHATDRCPDCESVDFGYRNVVSRTTGLPAVRCGNPWHDRPTDCPTCGPQDRNGLHVQKPPPDPRFCTDPRHPRPTITGATQHPGGMTTCARCSCLMQRGHELCVNCAEDDLRSRPTVADDLPARLDALADDMIAGTGWEHEVDGLRAAAARLRELTAELTHLSQVDDDLCTENLALRAAGDALANAVDALDIRPADAAPVDAALDRWKEGR